MQPKVSVIVPVFNIEKYIGKCLNSLVGQTLAEIEIIVVNDGSSDCSQDIIEYYAKNHPEKIRAYVKKNGGVSDARNFGIKQARGEYIGFMDGDDWADTGMYRLLYEKGQSGGADIVVCGYYKVDEDSILQAHLLGGMNLYDSSLKENPGLLVASAPYVWNKLYRAELLHRSGLRFPVEMVFEDVCFNYSVYLWARRIAKVNRPLYYYRLHREGAFNTAFDKKAFYVFDSLRMVNEYYIRQGVFDTFRGELLGINLGHLNTRMKSFVLSYGYRLKREYLLLRKEHLDLYFPGWTNAGLNGPEAYGRVLSAFCRHPFLLNLYAFFSIPPLRSLFKLARRTLKGLHALIKLPKALAGKAAGFYRCAAYARSRGKSILPNTVLFEMRHGRSIGCSPFYMLKETPGVYDCYVSSRSVKKHRLFLEQNGIRAEVVKTNSARYNRLLARAAYLVNNATFPPHFTARPEQAYLNTWHGTPLKCLGKEAKEGIADIGNIQRNFLISACLLYQNRFSMQSIMRDYDIDAFYRGRVVLAGYPRNAVFLHPEKGRELKERLQLTGKKIYAYMPTWRGASGRDAQADGKKIAGFLKKIDEALDENSLFFVKLHPLVQCGLNLAQYRHIRRFPDNAETYAFLNAADCLVTDYSSVLFDFAVTGREILLFMYDRRQYESLQGVYLDIDTLPFTKLYSIDALISHIRSGREFAPSKEYRRFAERYCPYESPAAAARLCRYFYKGAVSPGLRAEERAGMEQKAVEVVVMPNLTSAREQELFERLLSEGAKNRVFAFRQKGLDQATNDLVYQNRKKARYFILTDGSAKTFAEFTAVWLYRRFGLFKETARGFYKSELNRNFPNVHIAKLTDYSGLRYYSEMEKLFMEQEQPSPVLKESPDNL